MKKCQREKSHLVPMPGAYIPQCDTDGSYKPMQCHDSTGFCWCVDRNGTKILGTEKQGLVSCEAHQKTKCEQEASRVVLMLGAFVPQCDEKGDYLPKQCHGSTGHCWCVDRNGTRIAGTLRHGDATCQATDIQKKCRREAAKVIRMPGAFTPQCNYKGDYRPMQCHGSTGQCWCVDVNGDKILGSEHQGPVDCKAHDVQTKCQREAARVKPMPGAYIPQCDKKGDYQPKQCHGSTGLCWCVSRHGEMSGTKQRGELKCPEHAQTKCQKEAARVTPMPGAFIPKCDEKGAYLPMQCHASTGRCWCVGRRGKKFVETEQLGEVSCEGVGNLTKCEKEAESVPFGIVGAYMPQCNEHGHYEPIQCHSSTGYCWCATQNGTKIPGTEIRGTPKCDEHAQTKCQKEAASITPMPGAFIPQCDEEGAYLPKQCHGSTGFCWCVDHLGQKLLGTEQRGKVTCKS
ncbi:thyroglobulin-like [Protopterus annectens]|uniref:thyroglobulin-like n=1 Tax=Protopterus annectens TaxID=7888 RepID=UPI001CFA20F0|nr:thyroglobulin-like [Protopterus annectens]